MVGVSAKPLTLEDFLQRPETQPASEFIEGEIIQKLIPQGKHSRIQVKLGSFINEILEPPQVGMAFSELRCTFAGRAIVPDISVITWERIPVDEDGMIQQQMGTGHGIAGQDGRPPQAPGNEMAKGGQKPVASKSNGVNHTKVVSIVATP